MAYQLNIARDRSAAFVQRRLLLALMLVVAVTVFIFGPLFSKQSVSAAETIPMGLPAHFFLGLDNQPGDTDWMTTSGAAWDARYKYLVGGVNTGSGWANWNPNGDFATYYMQDSAAHGYLPIFTYYQLLQSAPATGGDEAEKNANNLNNTATMHAYYSDFKLLMDKIHGFGKPVIVHVEPDLFGFMQQRVVETTNSAASIPAAVASSGHPDASDLPDTFQGFNQTLLRLRDRYAPNALLAMHVSAWATNIDVSSTSDSNADVAGIAAKTVGFLNTAGLANNPSGMSSYDLLFFEASDRDSGFYQHQYGWGNWWDETNQTFPNFARFHQFVKAVTDGATRRAVLWQIPIGNTKLRSVNNTWGHYQDNRVQYWLGNYPNDGHLQDLANSGVIGILFGMGAGGVTSYQDDQGDGMTNPAAINGNTQQATVADDDGGYLREVATNYYRVGAHPIANVAAPTPTSTTYVPTATATPQPMATQTPVPSPTPTPVPTSGALHVYTDSLGRDWADWSWDPITRNLSNSSPVRSGTKSISVKYTGGWSALQLGRGNTLDLSGYDVLRFWIRGSNNPGQIEVRVGNANSFVNKVITPTANKWTQIEIPISGLASSGVTYMWWQNATASAQPTFYLDDIAFIDK